MLSLANWCLGYDDDAERAQLVELLDLRPGALVLEVWVGTGRNVARIQAAIGPGGRLIGQDLARGMLRQTQARLAASPPLVQSEAERLPFGSDRFDAVLHYGALHVFADLPAALAEIVRVTRPGGRIVLSDQGFHPARRRGWRYGIARRIIPFLARTPPLEQLPPQAEAVELHWLWRGDCFAIKFLKKRCDRNDR